jgi:hypothetical protein
MSWDSVKGTQSESDESSSCPECGALLTRKMLPGSPWHATEDH